MEQYFFLKKHVDKEQKAAEKEVKELEEKIIQQLARKDRQLRLDRSQFRAHARVLRLTGVAPVPSLLSPEEKQRRQKLLQLQLEEISLQEQLYEVLIAANNRR